MAKVDWTALKAAFIQQPTTTCAALAAEFGVSRQAVQYHCRREDWMIERAAFLANVEAKLVRMCAASAAEQLRQRNTEQLRSNRELREILDSCLLARRPDGSFAINGDVTILECYRAVLASSELYRSDRLALGASELPPVLARDRFAEMSDEELAAELKRVRQAEFAEASDEELAELGLQRKPPVLQ